jgi:hypothetical protein
MRYIVIHLVEFLYQLPSVCHSATWLCWGWEVLCVVVHDYVFHNSSNVTHLYVSFLKGTTRYNRVGLFPTVNRTWNLPTRERYSVWSFPLPKQCLVCLRLSLVSVVRTGFEPVLIYLLIGCQLNVFQSIINLPLAFATWLY